MWAEGNVGDRAVASARVGRARTTPCWSFLALAVLQEPPPAPFREEAVARGIDYVVPLQPGAGRGVALVDLDGDGDADAVAVGRADGAVGLWENDGTGHFTSRAAQSGLAAIPSSSGVTAADYDGDGDLDLYFTNWHAANRLARNEGGFTFTDVTGAAGVGDVGAGTGSSWGDYDGDGWVDLYVANQTNSNNPTPNRLFRNLGDGTFQDVAPALGVDDASLTWQSVMYDFDLDGDLDLYTSNDKGFGCTFHNHLFENVGGAFVDVTDASGTAACMFSMGVGLGDWDGNGHPDMYCTNMPLGNKLFTNQGQRVFLEQADGAGVGSYQIGWGALFFDLENDGDLDLYVCNQNAPNRMYVTTPEPGPNQQPCADLAASLGVADVGSSYTIAGADVDLDGDVDLLVQTVDQRLRLFVNDAGNQGNWARLEVVGRGANAFAVGATVRVRTQESWQLRQIAAGSNFKSQNEATLSFGLGHAATLDEIQVLWPGGTTRTLRDYPAGASWALYPPERLGDVDGDGLFGNAELAAFADCYTGPGPGQLRPGCEVLDVDGDGDVDHDDLAPFVGTRTRRTTGF